MLNVDLLIDSELLFICVIESVTLIPTKETFPSMLAVQELAWLGFSLTEFCTL